MSQIPCMNCHVNSDGDYKAGWQVCDTCGYRICVSCNSKHTGPFNKIGGGAKCSQCQNGFIKSK